MPTHWSNGEPQPVEPRLGSLGGPDLQKLIKKAYENNLDLQQAAARVKKAQLQSTIAGAAARPTLSAGANASRDERSRGLIDGVTTTKSEDYGLSLSAAWELDVWGKLAHRRSAALANAEAVQADFEAARLSLAGQVAKTWFNAVEAEMQVAIARDALQSFENNLALMRDRFQRGLTPALDIHLGEANVASSRNALSRNRQQRDQYIRSLETLLGEYPENALYTATTLPSLANPVPAGLPSELLKRRPDVKAAEQRLFATLQNSQEKAKDRWPSIRLTGRTGTSSDELKNIADWDFRFSNIAAGLTQPFFDAGRLKALADSAVTDAEIAELAYLQTALQAFREVEQSLANEDYLQEQVKALTNATQQYKAAEELAREQYAAGLIEILTVLDSQRRYYLNKQQLVQLKNQQLQNRVDVLLSLGGDPEVPAQRETKLILPLRIMNK